MRRFEIVIRNADASERWREGFDSKKDLNAWLNEEKTRPYWKKEFTTEILDNTAAVKAAEDALKAAVKAADDTNKANRADIKKLREKKDKTLADAVALLEKIVDHLGI